MPGGGEWERDLFQTACGSKVQGQTRPTSAGHGPIDMHMHRSGHPGHPGHPWRAW
jgi:hypothetical protein